MTPELRKHCMARKNELLEERAPFMGDWREVAEWADPYAGKHLFSSFTERQKLPSRKRILNSSMVKALRTMDAGFMGGHTSKARPWFKLGTADPALADNDDVKQWLDDETQAIRDTLARSNFYTALPKLYHSRHLFGVGAMACDADDEDVVRFYVRAIGTYAMGVDHRGRCSAFWYTFRRTAEQLAGEFGEDNLPRKVKDALKPGKRDTKFTVESLIEKNPDYQRGSRVAEKRAFRQTYWVDGVADDEGCIETTGFDRMPTLTPRWLVDGNDVYGPSPTLDCIGDIKQLQHQEGESLYLTDMISKPPLGLPSTMRNKGASLAPGSRTYITADQVGMQAAPLYTPDPRAKNEIRLDIERVEQRIGEHYFADLFRMLDFLDDRERTAFEIGERKEEKVAMLGPALESLTDELLDPVIEIVYYERQDRGMQKPMPEVLRGTELKVEYTSMLAQAAKAIGISTVERVLALAGNGFASTGDPAWLDKIDPAATVEIVHEMAGAPARMLVSDDAAAAKAQGRAQQQQMAQMAAMAPAMKQGAEAVKTAGEAVPQEGSAAETMLAGMMG